MQDESNTHTDECNTQDGRNIENHHTECCDQVEAENNEKQNRRHDKVEAEHQEKQNRRHDTDFNVNNAVKESEPHIPYDTEKESEDLNYKNCEEISENLKDNNLNGVSEPHMSYDTEDECHQQTYLDVSRSLASGVKSLTRHDILKLHLQLRHGTVSSVRNYIRAAGLWDESMEEIITDIIRECDCVLASAPKPHVKVATRPPSTDPQTRISIDVIHLGGENYIHSVDESTTWSEAGCISRKTMDTQISVLNRIQHLRHGAPLSIRCDNEYNNEEFRAFCIKHGTELIPVAANDHEANGLIENANRTLRSFYDRLRLCDKRSTGETITAEAIFGKNISLGSKGVSAFELLYGRRPRLLPVLDDNLPHPISIDQHAQLVAKRRINKMLRTPVYKTDDINVGDTVAIWRDASGWLAPARVTKVTPYYYEEIHNGRIKTTGLNRTRKIKPLNEARDTSRQHVNELFDDDDEELATEPSDELFQGGAEQHEDNTEIEDQIIKEGGCRGEQEVNRTSSNRIRRSEVKRLQEDALQIVGQRVGPTRSQTNAKRHEETPPSSSATHLHLTDSPLCKPLSEEERKKAFDTELSEWQKRGAYTAVDENEVPKENANIIGSHVAYKRKFDGTAKGRIVPWGHRDRDKDYLRGDAPSLSFEIFRLILSLCVAFGWIVGQMDVKAAFLQARGFNRLVFVRPPREASSKGILWRLNAAAFGLTDSGRLWYLTSDGELTHRHGLTRSRYDHTLYYSRDKNGNLDFVLAVQVDDYLYGGTPKRMIAFEEFLKGTFEVSKLARSNLSLIGCKITQHDDFSITLSQTKMLADLNPQLLNDAIGPNGD